MTPQTTDRRAEEDITETSYYRRRGRIQDGEDLEQENSMGKRKVLGMIEGIHSRGRHMGK